MATPLNVEVYERLGFDPAAIAAATPNDLLVAVRADDDGSLAAAVAALDAHARPVAPGRAAAAAPSRSRPHTLGVRASRRPWLARAHLGRPASTRSSRRWTRSRAGVSVMLFSDNVSVAQEMRLKDEAARRGVLVMGPDCGTAVVGGVGLGFANVLRPGPGRASSPRPAPARSR